MCNDKTIAISDREKKLKKQLCCCQEELATHATVDVDYDMSAICGDTFTFSKPVLTLTFVGEDGQGTYNLNLTADSGDSGQFKILKSLTGNFKIYLTTGSVDYIDVTLYTSGNVVLTNFASDGSGNGVSGVFDIQKLDHIIFGCISSG